MISRNDFFEICFFTGPKRLDTIRLTLPILWGFLLYLRYFQRLSITKTLPGICLFDKTDQKKSISSKNCISRDSFFKIDILCFIWKSFPKNSCSFTIFKSCVFSLNQYFFYLDNCFFQNLLVPVPFNQQLSLGPNSGGLFEPFVAENKWEANCQVFLVSQIIENQLIISKKCLGSDNRFGI